MRLPAQPDQVEGVRAFDAHFTSVDLDRDGRITCTEAVALFQAPNFPRHFLTQVALHSIH